MRRTVADDITSWVQHPYGRAKAPIERTQPEQVDVAYDIVASLKASAEWIKEIEHESWFETADLQTEAADEIKRLRAAGDALVDRLNDWHNGAPYDLDAEAIKAWKEANRG
jgi:hypothetical protein